jgi:hypothetical protein
MVDDFFGFIIQLGVNSIDGVIVTWMFNETCNGTRDIRVIFRVRPEGHPGKHVLYFAKYLF